MPPAGAAGLRPGRIGTGGATGLAANPDPLEIGAGGVGRSLAASLARALGAGFGIGTGSAKMALGQAAASANASSTLASVGRAYRKSVSVFRIIAFEVIAFVIAIFEIVLFGIVLFGIVIFQIAGAEMPASKFIFRAPRRSGLIARVAGEAWPLEGSLGPGHGEFAVSNRCSDGT